MRRRRTNALQFQLDFVAAGEVSLYALQNSDRIIETFRCGHLLRAPQQLTLALLGLVRRNAVFDDVPQSFELRISWDRSQSILDCRQRFAGAAVFEQPASRKELLACVNLELRPLQLRFRQRDLACGRVELPLRLHDLRLEGITQNQSFGMQEIDKPAIEIFLQIMRQANSDGKLVFIIKPKPDGSTLLASPSMAAMPWPDEKPRTSATCTSAAG